jgi:hypothetical protein
MQPDHWQGLYLQAQDAILQPRAQGKARDYLLIEAGVGILQLPNLSLQLIGRPSQ